MTRKNTHKYILKNYIITGMLCVLLLDVTINKYSHIILHVNICGSYMNFPLSIWGKAQSVTCVALASEGLLQNCMLIKGDKNMWNSKGREVKGKTCLLDTLNNFQDTIFRIDKESSMYSPCDNCLLNLSRRI